MKHAVLLALLVACKRDSSSGLPPAKDWQGGQPPAVATDQPPPANPHTGNPQPGPVDPNGPNPHAGVDMGQGTNPHGGADPSQPTQSEPKTLDKLADGKRVLGPFVVAIPAEWKEKPVTSSMRAADFMITDDAEMIVYYFGSTGAGSVDANLDRWMGQFTGADGKPVKDTAKVERTKFANQSATVVTVSGRYQAEAMIKGGEGNVDKSDQEMFAAIIDSPNGPYYFRAIGSKKTIDANLEKIRSMLTSMTVKS